MDTRRTEILIHWGGIAAALGGLVWIVGLVVAAGEPATVVRTYTPMMLAGLLVMGLGMIAAHIRLAERTGMMGYAALAFAGFSLVFMTVTWFLVESRLIDVIYFAMAFIFVLLSFFIFGLMGLLSGGMPRVAMGMLMLGILALPFMNIREGSIWQGVVFGLAWVWLGIDLVRAKMWKQTQVHA